MLVWKNKFWFLGNSKKYSPRATVPFKHEPAVEDKYNAPFPLAPQPYSTISQLANVQIIKDDIYFTLLLSHILCGVSVVSTAHRKRRYNTKT